MTCLAAYLLALATALVAYGALARAAARPVPLDSGRGYSSPTAMPPCPSPAGEKEGGAITGGPDAV